MGSGGVPDEARKVIPRSLRNARRQLENADRLAAERDRRGLTQWATWVGTAVRNARADLAPLDGWCREYNLTDDERVEADRVGRELSKLWAIAVSNGGHLLSADDPPLK